MNTGRRGFLKKLFVGSAVVASGKSIIGTPEQMKSISTTMTMNEDGTYDYTYRKVENCMVYGMQKQSDLILRYSTSV